MGLTARSGAAWFTWAAVFLTTPFFFHGFTIYPDGVGSLMVIAAPAATAIRRTRSRG